MNFGVVEFVIFALLTISVGCMIAAIVEYITSNSQTPLNEFEKNRLVVNLEILQILLDYTARHPSQRFGQILRNTGILQDVGVRDSSKEEWETPDFYIDRALIHEEPHIILERMQKELAEQEKNS